MLALASGYLLPELLRRSGVQRLLLGFTALVAMACVAGFVWLTFVDAEQSATLLADGGLASFAPLAAIGAAAVIALLVFRLQRAHLALLSTIVTLWAVVGLWVMPQMDGTRSARDFIARVEAMAAPDRELGLLAYHEHFLWNLQRPTVNFGHRRFREGDAEIHDAAAWLAAEPARQLLVQEQMLEPCFKGANAQLVGDSSRGNWFLVTGSPDPACVALGDAHYNFAYSPRSN
jgi:hypothetical protein